MDVSTVGDTPDPDGYTVSLDGGDPREVDPNGGATYTGLSEGEHDVELSGLQVNCVPDGSNPRSVSVTAGDTVASSFSVSCPAALLDRVAFATDRDGDFEIYAIRSDGSSPARITESSSNAMAPAISPDGTAIAFHTDRDGEDNLYMVDTDGTDLGQVTSDSALDRAPTWSPDGTTIVFQSERTGQFNVFSVAADGTGVVNLTNETSADGHPDWGPRP